MPIHAAEDHRVVSRYGVEVLARGKTLFGPERVVPTAAGNPFARLVLGQAHAESLLELGE